MKIRLTKEQKIKINSAASVYAIMRPILMRQNEVRRRQEYFWVIGISSDLDLDYVELVGIGSISAVAVKPVDIFSFAVQKKSLSVILVHNHPGGTLRPSEGDQAFTERMKTAAEVLEIQLLDHVIITENGFYSMQDEVAVEI